jgi:hypothetical protein
MNPRKTGLSAAFAAGVAILTQLGAAPAAAQNWNGGNGNWSNPANWDCACVPSGGDEVRIGNFADSGGVITLDTNVTIGAIFGFPNSPAPGGSMTIAGMSLTTTETGFPTVGLDILNVSAHGSVIASGGVNVVTLNATDATLNAGVQAASANIVNTVINGNLNGSSNGSSLDVGRLTLQDSVVGPGGGGVTGAFTITNSTVNGDFGFEAKTSASSITGSTFSGLSGVVDSVAVVDIRNSTLTAPSRAGNLRVVGGDITIESGTTWLGLDVLSVENGGNVTLDGAGSKMSVTSGGFPLAQVDSTSTISVLNVRNGAQLVGAETTGADLEIGNGSLLISSGGQVSMPDVASGGSIAVSGSGSKLTSQQLVFGAGGAGAGAGLFMVSDGAAANIGSLVFGGSVGPGGELSVTTGGTVNYKTLSAPVGAALFAGETPIYVTGGGALIGAANQSGDSIAVSATVTGAGSRWSPESGLEITGGKLTVADGGQLTTDLQLLGTGNANLQVTGSSSLLKSDFVSLSESANLGVSAGGRLSANAFDLDGDTTAQVFGPGSQLTASSVSVRDLDGSGSQLTVTLGGALSADTIQVGNSAGRGGASLFVTNQGSVQASKLVIQDGLSLVFYQRRVECQRHQHRSCSKHQQRPSHTGPE